MADQTGPIELSPEQQFNLAAFKLQSEKLDEHQCKHLLVDLYRQIMLKDNAYKLLLSQQWGIQPQSLYRRSDG